MPKSIENTTVFLPMQTTSHTATVPDMIPEELTPTYKRVRVQNASFFAALTVSNLLGLTPLTITPSGLILTQPLYGQALLLCEHTSTPSITSTRETLNTYWKQPSTDAQQARNLSPN